MARVVNYWYDAPIMDIAIAKLLRSALLEIRWHWRIEQAGALADAVHDVPVLGAIGELNIGRLRDDLERYHAAYPDKKSLLYDYVSMLNEIEPTTRT